MATGREFDEHHSRIEGDTLAARSTPRVAASLPAKLLMDALPGPLACRLRDIGSGGVCVETASPFDIRSLRRIAIPLPSCELVLEVEGIWQRETSLERAVLTGMRLVDLDPGDGKRIREFVHESANVFASLLQDDSDLSSLELDEALDLALFSRLREAREGSYVFHENEPRAGHDSLFIVIKGKVVLEASAARGHELELEALERGGLFGGLPLIAGVSPPLSAVAVQDVTLLEISRDAFRYLERTRPSVTQSISRIVVAKSVAHLRTAISLALPDSPPRSSETTPAR